MNISLDFDDTYTRDPLLWDNFVASARRHGHKVYVVTMRYKEEGQEVVEALQENVDMIIFTGRMAKKPYVAKMMINIDVYFALSLFPASKHLSCQKHLIVVRLDAKGTCKFQMELRLM